MPTTRECLDRLAEKDYDCIEKYRIRKTDGVNRYKIAIKVTDHLPYELRHLLSGNSVRLLSNNLDGTLVLHLTADVTHDGVDISASTDD